MCGRFAQALPRPDYIDAVDDALNRRRRRRGGGGRATWKRTDESGGGGESSKEADTSSQRAADTVQLDAALLHDDDYHPTHNVAPGVQVPIVRLQRPVAFADKKHDDTDNALVVQTMRWGLLPHHVTAIPRGGDALRTINARDDVVLSGQSMWTPLLRSGKRCVVFAQGFYEWLKKDGGATRIAHFVGMQQDGAGRTDVDGRKRALMPMAGLWECCTIDDRQVYSFTVITTESNKQLSFLHDRMPVILPDEHAIRVWLGMQPDATTTDITKLLKPYDAGTLDCYAVPREVGRVGNDNANFILPVSKRKDGIQAAFGKVKAKQAASSPQKNADTNAPMEEELKAIREPEATTAQQQADDEALARKLQQREDEVEAQHKAPSPSSSPPPSKRPRHRQPSSKFSPEPFNPPVSPPRPNGGWSTEANPDPAPYKRTGKAQQTTSPQNSAKQRRLQESAKGTKDIRSFFAVESEPKRDPT